MMLPEIFSKDGFILEGFLTSCTFNYLNREFESRIHMMILLFGGFIIPLLTILIFNLMMFIRLRPNEFLYRDSGNQFVRKQSKFKEIQKKLSHNEKESVCISDVGLDDLAKLKDLEDRLTRNKTCSNFSVKSFLIRLKF